jgi:DinB superfamily
LGRYEVKVMRKIGLICLAALVSGSAMAQMAGMSMPSATAGAAGPAAEVQRGYAAGKKNILKSADLMPAESFSYKPEPDIRTFARVINHISEAQLRVCGTANGTEMASLAKVPAETADKATIIAALNASFAECDRAYAALTDANLTESFAMGPMKRSRIGLMWGNVSHNNEQYATLALYLRLKGIAPPSSEK